MGWDGPTTHRQFQAWQRWLDEEWNRPSRADHYAMQIAAAMTDGRPHKIEFGAVDVAPKDEDLPPGFPRRMTKESIQAAEQKYIRDRIARGRSGTRKDGRPAPW